MATDHGLGLIVGHQNKSPSQFALQPAQIILDLGAQAGIQGAHGFVQQKHLRFIHQGPRQSHALFLAAGQLMGVAPGHAA